MKKHQIISIKTKSEEEFIDAQKYAFKLDFYWSEDSYEIVYIEGRCNLFLEYCIEDSTKHIFWGNDESKWMKKYYTEVDNIFNEERHLEVVDIFEFKDIENVEVCINALKMKLW